MGVAALVQIVVEFIRQLLGGERLCLVEAVRRERFAVVPPFHDGGEMLKLHRLRFRKMLVAVRHVETIEPRLLRGARAVEEKNVRRDGRVGGEDASGHADDRMEVELRQQLTLEVDLRVVRPEEEAVRQDDGGAAVPLQAVHDDGHEQVGGFAGSQVRREVALHVGLLAAAVGGIHEDDVEAVVVGIVQDVFQ